MTWHIYIYIIRFAYLLEGEKQPNSNKSKKRLNEIKLDGAEITFNIKL